MKRSLFLLTTSLLFSACATLFGWDIHAPGMLSAEFASKVRPMDVRTALYIPPGVSGYQSVDKGSRFADPQTYHVGEAFVPMLIEGFQQAFTEFILLEVEPTASILKQYGVSYLALVTVTDFGNHVTLKGQALALVTETAVYGPDLNLLMRYESKGVSDTQKVFAKKGGPEVNLNAALEQNILAVVSHLQDTITVGRQNQAV